MSNRDALLSAVRRASEVLDEFEAKKRIAAGYTRIDAELIASASDVVVLYRKFENLLGGFLREEGTPGIIVNWDRPRGLVHMTCAHELGHFALDHASTSDLTVDVGQDAALIEQQANKFAYALLAPAWLVAKTMRVKRWGRDDLRKPAIVYQLSLRLGMSYKAMVWSLVGLAHLALADALRIVDTKPISIKRDALSGNAPNKSKKDVWVLGPSDRDRILEPSFDDQFVFELPNHAGSGHLWTIDEVQSEGFTLEPYTRDARLEAAAVKQPILVGGDGKPMRYEMTLPPALDFGGLGDEESEAEPQLKRHLIAMQEVIPWRKELEVSDSFTLGAEFEELKSGFPKFERTRRLAESRRD
jgi:Zn-dependent peptidase ImmA (M78 family)